MSKFKMDLSKFKKVKSDKNTTTLKHESQGHEIRVSHSALSPENRQALEKLPMHKYADGSPDGVSNDDQKSDPAPDQQTQLGSDLPDISKDDLTKIGTAGMQGQEEEQNPWSGIGQSTPPADKTPASAMFPGMGSSEQEAALKEQQQGAMGANIAKGDLGKQMAAAQDNHQSELMQSMQNYDKANAQLGQERQNIQADIANGHINPKRYIENMSTGDKILSGVGLILGGMGSGLTHGPNLAFQYLNNQIDHDIDSQKAELGKNENLLSHNLQATGNLRAATQLTRMQLNDMLSSHIGSLAGQAQSKEAAANGMTIKGMFDAQTAQLHHNTAMMMGASSGGGDPAKLVPLLVPEHQQQKAFDEIEAAENTKSNAPSILKSFDNAANKIHATDFVPGMQNVDQKSMHALLGPTFKDVEGTVRQAAMDNLYNNVTPQFGDNAETTKKKRDALVGYLNSKQSAPVNRGHYIDLKNFSSTAPQQGAANTQTMNGVQYEKVAGGWKKVK